MTNFYRHKRKKTAFSGLFKFAETRMNTGGEGGIRTPDTCYSTPDFESRSRKPRNQQTRMDKRLLDVRTVR